MYPFQAGVTDTSSDKDSEEAFPLLDTEVPTVQDKNANCSSEKVALSAVAHTEPGFLSIQTVKSSDILESLPQFLDSNVVQLKLKRPEDITSGVDSAVFTLAGGKKLVGADVNSHDLVNVLNKKVIMQQLEQHIPSYQTLKKQLSLTKEARLQREDPAIVNCEFVKIEPVENSESNKEQLPEVNPASIVFPCETVKTEVNASEGSSTDDLQNVRTDLFSYRAAPGVSKEIPQVIQSGTVFSYRGELCSNDGKLEVLPQNVIPFQTVKIEVSSNSQAQEVAALSAEPGILVYRQVKMEGCSGDENSDVLGQIQHAIIPYQAVKTQLGPAEDELLSIVQFATQSASCIGSQTGGGQDKLVTEEYHNSCSGVGTKDVERRVCEGSHTHKWNAEIMQQAVAAVRSGLMSSTGAAKHFNLPRTTLRRHLQPGGVTNSKMEGREPQSQKWNADVMDEAVAVVLSGQMSSTKAAKHYNLPRTTLRRYIRTGGVTRFTEQLCRMNRSLTLILL
ncbi:uncharacterized protein [Anabrus simplex]|uniref:uncharacterized protein n=1 Tax=Anabrus simplex TaxID=316456 RepID=UPI0035A326E8